MKLLYSILFLIFYAHVAPCQSPAYHKYGIDDGLPDLREIGVGYDGDSIFVSLLGGEMYYFDGAKFHKTAYPLSKYYMTRFYPLDKGDMLSEANSLWYRKYKETWQSIPYIQRIILFDDRVYGFDTSGVYKFNEQYIRWEKIYLPDSVNVDNFYFYTYIDKDNNINLGLKNRRKGLIYDIESRIYLNYNSSFDYVGNYFGQNLYLDSEKGVLKWKYCDSLAIPLISPRENVVFLSGEKSIDDKSPISFVISESNKHHFFSLDTFCNIDYYGTLNLAASTILKIRNDMFFAISFGGVYKINPFISYYDKNAKNISSMVIHKGNIFTGSYGFGFYKLSNNGFEPFDIELINHAKKNILPGGFAVSDNEAWFFIEGNPSLYRLKENKINRFHTVLNGQEKYITGYFIDTLSGGRLAFGVHEYGLCLVDSIVDDIAYLQSIDKMKGNNLFNVLAFDQDNINRIWMGRYSTGISIYDMQKDTAVTFDYTFDNKKSFGAISMIIDSFDQLWIGTNRGLYLLHDVSNFDIYNDDIFEKAEYICLPNNDKSSVNALKLTKKYIVAGNISSINFIPRKNYNNGFLNEKIYQLLYGIDINDKGVQQNGMLYDGKKYLWIAAIEGILRINMNLLNFDTTTTNIYFDQIVNGGTVLKNEGDFISLARDKRNLQVSFKQKSNPLFSDNLFYSYLLTNKHNDTIAYQFKDKNNILQVDYMSPGAYKLQVEALKYGVLNDRLQLNIRVPYMFWENPWTKTIFISLFLIGLIVYLYYRKEKIKRTSKQKILLSSLKNEKEALKVQAIISSFNPHFINNSLHWIQSKYYKDKDMTRMVGRLSENINYIFKKTRSGDAIHTLEEELNLVENYVAIQKIRFGDSFEYKKPEVAGRIANIKVIMMQIQIHVENAIEHGLRNRKDSTFVEVSLKEDVNYFYIYITDDGIGRARSKKILSSGNKTGIQMLKDLHNIYNNSPKNVKNIKSEYIDEIFEQKGSKYGTTVKISIPKGFVYNL